MEFKDLKETIEKFDQLSGETPNALVAISQSKANVRAGKKFFDKFFEIADGGNVKWDD